MDRRLHSRQTARRMQHQTIEANGLRFAYFEEGSGPLVLLVHGFPDTAHTWDDVRPALAEAGYRAVSPFTRGYAPTEIPTDERFDSETLGADLIALIEALGEQSAILVGHDWGASASFSAVGLSPERVRKLVTIAIPHPASLKPSLRMLWRVRHFFTLSMKGAPARMRRRDFAQVDELVRRWAPTWNVPAGETDAVKAAFREPGCVEAALGYYRALKVGKVPKAQRGRVKVPSIAFAGEDDIIEPEAYDRAASRYEGPYEVVRMPGGHFMHREHPDRFIPELLRVLGPA